jgi:hypothetical protein
VRERPPAIASQILRPSSGVYLVGLWAGRFALAGPFEFELTVRGMDRFYAS